MKNFEENLKKLEELASDIKRSDISLEDALKDFEAGIKLAKSLEKELDSIEGKIQILMKEPTSPAATEKTDAQNTSPDLELFDARMELTGTRNA